MTDIANNYRRLANLRDLTRVAIELVQDGHCIPAMSAITAAEEIVTFADLSLSSVIPGDLANARINLSVLGGRNVDNALELLQGVATDLS